MRASKVQNGNTFTRYSLPCITLGGENVPLADQPPVPRHTSDLAVCSVAGLGGKTFCFLGEDFRGLKEGEMPLLFFFPLETFLKYLFIGLIPFVYC